MVVSQLEITAMFACHVAGLDLARRSDFSALVLLDAEPDRLIVSAALRLPQAPLRQQFALIAPHLAGLDLLVFDQSGLGDAAAELLRKHHRTWASASSAAIARLPARRKETAWSSGNRG